MSITEVRIFLVVLGLVFIVVGICFYLGYCRAPIVHWTIYSSGIYAFAPMGVGFLLMCLMTWFPYPETVGIWLMNFSFLFSIIGVFLGLTMPQLITPWWFRYLREEYEDQYIFHTLMKEAAKDYSGWKKRTSTMEGLVSWAKEIDEQATMCP